MSGAEAAPNETAMQRAPWGPPRALRMLGMAFLFFVFFFGSPVIALFVFPVLGLLSRERRRERATWLLHKGMRLIMRTAALLGIVGLELPPPPASVDLRKPYVMISNHPTYVDMLVVLGTFDRLTCVTSGRWSRHWALGRLLRSTLYLPGPGSGLPESEEMLATMVTHLGKHPLLIFPEGQRSLATGLRRFRRGAVLAATQANVPIVPLFLAIDRPYLTKNVPLWRPPLVPPTYTFEWFEPIDPAAFDHDHQRIQKHLEGLYQARYAEQLDRYRTLEPRSALAA